jgi:tetratricopeptide (TPR) repeat protein
MVGDLVNVGWTNGLLRSGWRVVTRGQPQDLLFSKWALHRIPRHLRDSDLCARFERLVSGTRLQRWWDGACGGGEVAFSLDFAKGAWDIPWELLLQRTEVSPNGIAIVRRAGASVPLAPAVFGERLRLLILLGSDVLLSEKGESLGQRLDLQAEAEALVAAWEGLETHVKACIERPVVLRTTSALSGVVAEHRPHIVWFSGHGRAKPPALLFADGTWTSPAALAQHLVRAEQAPLYAVFWACDTGRSEKGAGPLLDPPAFIHALSSAGVVSAVVMQAPVRDVSARAMARDFLRHLAGGLPLERAVARVRAGLLESPPDGAHPLDWASPVTWGSAGLVRRLIWNAGTQRLAQLQLLGRQSFRAQAAMPAVLESSSTPGELERAAVWTETSRVWVHSPRDPESQYRWLRVLQAIQISTERFVIAVELEQEDPLSGLQDWAASVYERVLPGDAPEEVARILAEMRASPLPAWRRLCALPGIHIGIVNPPGYSRADPFWQALPGPSAGGRVAILSDLAVTSDVEEDWTLDQIIDTAEETGLEQAVAAAPRLAAALAILKIPLASTYVALDDERTEPSSPEQWSGRRQMLLQTPGGWVMTATARRYVVSRLSADQRRAAHVDCAAMLGHVGLQQTLPVRERRVEHLIGAGFDSDAVVEVAELCRLYRAVDRPLAVVRIVKRLSSRQVDLPATSRLPVAWAYAQLGRLDEARYWLERSVPSSPLDLAWQHGLQAEIEKGRGLKREALTEIEAAIAAARQALGDRSLPHGLAAARLRAYRQDHARILQFLLHEPEAAAAEYDTLVQEWSDDPDATIDLAVVKRNYAECLRSLAQGVEDERLRRSRELLGEARALMRGHPEAPLTAEIFYELSRDAEARSDQIAAREYLDECRSAAGRSGHFMVLAIAEARAFWRHEPFVLGRWEEIAERLAAFPAHGWAVRTLIDGRLRAARQLMAAAEGDTARRYLLANLNDLERNPSFDQGSDRFRIAATYAGLEITRRGDDDDAPGWNTFLGRHVWGTSWVGERGNGDPEEIWAAVR